MNQNLLILVSSVSGGGKTSIVTAALERLPNFVKLITCTTRSLREHETAGKDYFFMSKDDFELKIEEDYFLEWSEVYGNFYGTSLNEVERNLAAKKNCFLVVDVQGAEKIRKKKIPNLISVFIKPPSKSELFKRLELRQTETQESLNRRIREYDKEIQAGENFDFCFINNSLENTINDFVALAEDQVNRLADKDGTSS